MFKKTADLAKDGTPYTDNTDDDCKNDSLMMIISKKGGSASYMLLSYRFQKYG